MVSEHLNLTGDAVHPGRSVLSLSVALSDNPRTRPVIEGRVPFEGLRLLPTVVHPSEMFCGSCVTAISMFQKCRCRH